MKDACKPKPASRKMSIPLPLIPRINRTPRRYLQIPKPDYRKIEAGVLLSNLCDQFVTDLVEEFPVGKLVIGGVLSVEPLSNRAEVTLKTLTVSSTSKSEIFDLGKFHVIDVISGRIKQVESFGFFLIAIDNANMFRLSHVSEISDSHIENIEAKFGVGEKVNAIVLKVDKEKAQGFFGNEEFVFDGRNC